MNICNTVHKKMTTDTSTHDSQNFANAQKNVQYSSNIFKNSICYVVSTGTNIAKNSLRAL